MLFFFHEQRYLRVLDGKPRSGLAGFEKNLHSCGLYFFQKPWFSGTLPFYAHETKTSILQLFTRIKKMSDMKNNRLNIANGMKQNSASTHCRINIKKKSSRSLQGKEW
jgi:hypothetical protein